MVDLFFVLAEPRSDLLVPNGTNLVRIPDAGASSLLVSDKTRNIERSSKSSCLFLAVDLFLFDGAAERPARSEWNESGSHSKRSRRRACSPAASAGILPLGQNPVVTHL